MDTPEEIIKAFLTATDRLAEHSTHIDSQTMWMLSKVRQSAKKFLTIKEDIKND